MSVRISRFLGRSVDDLLGLPLCDILDADLLHKPRTAGQLPSFDIVREPIGVLEGADEPLDVAAFATGAHVVRKFKRSGGPPWSNLEVTRDVTKLLDQINGQTDVPHLLNSTVRWLGRVTGLTG